ncbi:Calmodulin calcium-dependent NAD kinase [Sesamum alatum]|uniref:Calmodulin calcium-dependent NAD kinase n=1 Tax=Sesamum alatum TaxID=300844 RepID=A0AAE1XUL0_9LAMI|nr:Calmodulin calcium-dependent NAD kinase [Sesamum alatum]
MYTDPCSLLHHGSGDALSPQENTRSTDHTPFKSYCWPGLQHRKPDKWGSVIEENAQISASWLLITLDKLKGLKRKCMLISQANKTVIPHSSSWWKSLKRCSLQLLCISLEHASYMLSQVLGAESEPKKKLKHNVMAATREQRFERVTKNLEVARVFNTLVEEMKAIGLVSLDNSLCTNVMVPMAHKDRSPVLLLGGGMQAGKSTVLNDILKEPFWGGASGNAVGIEADAFKESDVI